MELILPVILAIVIWIGIGFIVAMAWGGPSNEPTLKQREYLKYLEYRRDERDV